MGLDADQNPVLNSGIELDRDNHQPSQFPWNTDELRDETKLPGDPRAMSFYRFEPLTSGVWNCDACELRIHEDGAVNLKLNGTETAVVYRGIVCASEGEDGFRLAFALTKNGGTTEPFVGTCELVFNDDQTITLKTADEALPLIPEGSNEITLQR